MLIDERVALQDRKEGIVQGTPSSVPIRRGFNAGHSNTGCGALGSCTSEKQTGPRTAGNVKSEMLHVLKISGTYTSLPQSVKSRLSRPYCCALRSVNCSALAISSSRALFIAPELQLNEVTLIMSAPGFSHSNGRKLPRPVLVAEETSKKSFDPSHRTLIKKCLPSWQSASHTYRLTQSDQIELNQKREAQGLPVFPISSGKEKVSTKVEARLRKTLREVTRKVNVWSERLLDCGTAKAATATTDGPARPMLKGRSVSVVDTSVYVAQNVDDLQPRLGCGLRRTNAIRQRGNAIRRSVDIRRRLSVASRDGDRFTGVSPSIELLTPFDRDFEALRTIAEDGAEQSKNSMKVNEVGDKYNRTLPMGNGDVAMETAETLSSAVANAAGVAQRPICLFYLDWEQSRRTASRSSSISTATSFQLHDTTDADHASTRQPHITRIANYAVQVVRSASQRSEGAVVDSAQNPAWPGGFNPTRVPSPQDPVGRKREHTPRHDSRQWNVGSSKNRQTSLQESASSHTGQTPSPSNPHGRGRSHMQRAQLRQSGSDGHTGISQEQLENADQELGDALLPGFQTPELRKSRASRDELRKFRREERPEQTQGDETRRADRGSQKERLPEEKTNRRDRPGSHDAETKLAEFAPGPDFMQLTSSESDDDELISKRSAVPEMVRNDAHVSTSRVVMPKFQASEFVNLNTPCVSPSHDSEVDNALERVRQSHSALVGVLNEHAGHQSEPDSEGCGDVVPKGCHRPGPTVAAGSPVATRESRRPSWARVGHHGIRSWNESHDAMDMKGVKSEPGFRLEIGSRQGPSSAWMDGIAELASDDGTSASKQMNALISQVEAGIQDTRNISSNSTMSAWRDAAINAVLHQSAEAEAETE
ncbi:hypothetical protein CERZMDRAFT_86770 [Cercospora zeae-maydis SCOH1-5]|uniref:Uncharacterized protein n=1 Tax=Cercospora zeae-maydis SCOH1-5 TaxID=717836 RepID=A0A6A6F8M3_9PEZI|nr:hypothetical protein CERZMDRAFT_86770 [Cercospora zeae-maydis SCOH1-5]